MAVGPQHTVLYSVASRVLAVALMVVCAIIEASLIAFAHPEVTLRATPAVLLVAVGAFVLFWRPRVELSPSELTVVNPLRTHHITWPAIRNMDTRWSLTVETVRGRVTAWATPAPGLLSQLGRLRRDAVRVSLARGREQRGAELSRSLIVQQWEAYRDAGALGAVEGAGVSTRWNIPATVAVDVLTIGAVLGAVWP